MLLSNNFKRASSCFAIFSFCLVFIGCDYVKQQKEISLKGEKITAEFSKNIGASSDSKCCSKGKSSYEIYEVNTNSPKAEELKNKIISNLEELKNKSTKNTSSSNDPQKIQEPDIDNSIIVEDTETGQESVITPIDNGSDMITQRAYQEYDSETNTFTSQMYYYKAESNISVSELEANPNLADNVTLQIEFKDQNGNIEYSRNLTSNDLETGIHSSSKQDQLQGCFGDCVKTVFVNFEWYNYIICALAPVPCVTGVVIFCGFHCWF